MYLYAYRNHVKMKIYMYVYLLHVSLVHIYDIYPCISLVCLFRKIAKLTPKFFSKMFRNYHTQDFLFPSGIQTRCLPPTHQLFAIPQPHQTEKDSGKEGVRVTLWW